MTATSVQSTVRRVVVVDDTPDLRTLLRIALESTGDFEVVAEAGDGLEGVEAVGRSRPHLVLLDLAMPVMDGLEALPMIRRLLPASHVVVLSGFEEQAMAEHALEAGADGYLQKGIATQHMLDYLRGVVFGPDYSPPAPRLKAVPAAGSGVPDVPQQTAAVSSRPHQIDPLALAARTAAEQAGIGLLLVETGPELRITFANRAAETMLGAPAVPGSTLTTLDPDLKTALTAVRSRLLSGEQVRASLTLRGRALDVVSRACAVPTESFVVALSEPLVASDEGMLRRVLATTAHETRNPLTVLTWATETLRHRDDTLSEAQRDHLLATMARQVAALDRITEDLLVSAGERHGSLEVTVRPLRVVEVVNAAVADLPEGTEVTVTGAVEVRAQADGTRLGQMMANLLSNALKYGAPPYRVDLARASGRDGPEVHIAVEDCGGGVPGGFRERLFEEFARADPGSSYGTGLGLFVVRSLAVAQGGWVEYRPRPEGGSVFTIVLHEAVGA